MFEGRNGPCNVDINSRESHFDVLIIVVDIIYGVFELKVIRITRSSR